MKKIILSAIFFFACLGLINAQTAPKNDTAKTASASGKMAKHSDKAAVKTNTTGLKKDGTPDMRMKQNKDSTKKMAAGPLKKNGTADMRYKANKKK